MEEGVRLCGDVLGKRRGRCGAGIADVDGFAVGREGDPVGLDCSIVDDVDGAGTRAEAVG